MADPKPRYALRYRCRLCGRNWSLGPEAGDPNVALHHAITPTPQGAPLLLTHLCSAIHSGVSDLIGAEALHD